jgi:predicted ATP-grasp superfamily ATP-dependent carboligase
VKGTVLLLGNYMPSLTAARSLAASGYRVLAGDGGEFSTVGLSRHCRGIWEHPPVRNGDQLVRALAAFLSERPDIRIVLPLQERYVELLATHGHELPSDAVVAMPARDVVLTCLSKARMYALAAEAGVPHPASRVVLDLASLRAAGRELGYPCVVRPVTGSAGSLPGEAKAVVCRDAAELDRRFETWPLGHQALMVDVYVSGPRINVHFAAARGRVIARVQTMALRTDRLDGTGIGVEGISLTPDPAIDSSTRILCERLGYTGVGLAQFLRPESGPPRFLELNPRLGIALALVRRCGLDLPLAACRLALDADGWDVSDDVPYPVGMRYAWTSWDLHALGAARARREIGCREALQWLVRTARAAARADVHATWDPRDPLPTIAIYAQWLPGGPWKRTPLRDRLSRSSFTSGGSDDHG